MNKIHLDKKILCTLGPASMNDRVITRLTDLGASLFRINLSHTKLEDVAERIDFIKARTDVPVCLDTEGAQIRTGGLLDGKIVLEENALARVLRKSIVGTPGAFNFYPLNAMDHMDIGDVISIDFNSVLVRVVEKNDAGLILKVICGGVIGQNKAVSADRDIHLSALTEKDKTALAIGMEKGIRHVALSFANYPDDIDEIRRYVHEDTYIISKIESINGVKNLWKIANKCNAILIDRGDLSRQVAIEQIPRAQKEIINRAKQADVEIFVATNLLESMVESVAPTRAEVNDVFNTLVDGADGLVLASETAVGSYPVQCATMISKIIQQFAQYRHGSSSFLDGVGEESSFTLIGPHGGVLVDRCDFYPDYARISQYKKLTVHIKDIINAEQIAVGSFSPLEGFMNKEEVTSVVERYQLPDGTIWPLPIMLQVPQKEAAQLHIGQRTALCLGESEDIYAVLDIEDIYTCDLKELTEAIFHTSNRDHPGVDDIFSRDHYFLGGKITLIKRLPSRNKHFEMTPRQVRKIFGHKGWTRIVGFHTRNVAHRAHEYIQKAAFEKHHCDGILIHPLVGPKKKGDYTADIILQSYEIMIDKYYPSEKVLLAAFQNYPRYSGPREAVFTALCRKNYGCTHFVVGRDHSGVNGYYEKDGARKLFEALGDIGIQPIFFGEVHYCRKCKCYVEQCAHGEEDVLRISGTQGRKMLMDKVLPPEWFMREELSKMIIGHVDEGNTIFHE